MLEKLFKTYFVDWPFQIFDLSKDSDHILQAFELFRYCRLGFEEKFLSVPHNQWKERKKE